MSNSVIEPNKKLDETSEIEDSPDFSSVAVQSGADESCLQYLNTSLQAYDGPLDRSCFDELCTSSPN